MVVALEHDECIRRRLKVAPLRVRARQMDLQRARASRRPDRERTEPNWPRAPGAIADQETEDAVPDQRVQLRQILVAMERGFVQGGLVGRLCGAYTEGM